MVDPHGGAGMLRNLTGTSDPPKLPLNRHNLSAETRWDRYLSSL